MKRKRKDCSGWLGKYRRANMVIACMLLVLALGVVGFNLTEAKVEKAQKTNSESMQTENKDSGIMEKNPLKPEDDSEVAGAVREYYNHLTENTEFAESYDDVQVYTKLGKYKDSYVAFVRYEMKIKDVYTKVPGLGTVYVEKNKDNGKYDVSASVKDEKLTDFVQKVAQHEDVQTLMADIGAQYQTAVESDALLKEALADLKNAYEDSTGTSSEG